MLKVLAALGLCVVASGCVLGTAVGVTGAVVGTTAKTAVKATGAVVGAAIPDGDKKDKSSGDD